MNSLSILTPYQSQYVAWLLSRRMAGDSADLLASTLVDAQVDLNPHQVDAALFAFESPLSKGVILADEVGLAAVSDAGEPLHEEDSEKLLRLPAEFLPIQAHELHESSTLETELKQQESRHIRAVNSRNLGYFEAEVQKLDAWADDLKSGLETEVKELDREIKEMRRTAAVSATLEEKLNWQKRQRELEEKRGQLRRKIFDRQDEIDAQRNKLIEDLESKLNRRTQTTSLFAIQWSLE